MTFGKKCMDYKDQIKHALNNEVIDGYDEGGMPIYVKTEKTETNKAIIEIFDEVVYQALQAMTSGRALDRLYHNKVGEAPNLQEYIKIVEEERLKYNDYQYDGEEKGNIIQFPCD